MNKLCVASFHLGFCLFFLGAFILGNQKSAIANDVTPAAVDARTLFNVETQASEAPCKRRVRLQYKRHGVGSDILLHYFLIEPCLDGTDHDTYPEVERTDAKAILVLFSGGNGLLGIGSREPGSMNYVVRQRYAYAAAVPAVVAVIDAASDFQSNSPGKDCSTGGGLRGCRLSEDHMIDIATLIQDVRNVERLDENNVLTQPYQNLPVWLIGTSRGAISAVAAADLIHPDYGPDGIILTSAVFNDPDVNEDVLDADLGSITVPVQIITHGEDECIRSSAFKAPAAYESFITGFTNAEDVKTERLLLGGYPAIGEDCGPLSPHGFFGLETKVAGKIVNFILKHAD